MNEQKKSFTSRVIELFKGSDESKIDRFHKRELKYLNDQVRLRENDISDLKEKKADILEEYNEAIYNVDMDAIKTTESSKSYVESYTDNLFLFQVRIKDLEDSIETTTEEIEAFKGLIKDLK